MTWREAAIVGALGLWAAVEAAGFILRRRERRREAARRRRAASADVIQVTAAVDQARAWAIEHREDLRRIHAGGIAGERDHDIARRACGLCVVAGSPGLEISVEGVGAEARP